jgi:hypothetical protein
VPYHYSQAVEILTALKAIKNPKFQLEVTQTLAAWSELKMFFDSSQNSSNGDQLAKLRAEVARNVKAR